MLGHGNSDREGETEGSILRNWLLWCWGLQGPSLQGSGEELSVKVPEGRTAAYTGWQTLSLQASCCVEDAHVMEGVCFTQSLQTWMLITCENTLTMASRLALKQRTAHPGSAEFKQKISRHAIL